MSTPTTLVVGASGQIGSTLVELLLAAGQQVRALSSRSRASERAGLQWVQADLFGGAALAQAFAGVDQAFLLAPPGHVPQHELLLPAIAAARAQGVKKLVLMTAMGADADPNSPFSIAERTLRESGMAWNVIRPNWFMQNFASYWLHGIQTAGAIQVPAGEAATSFIDTRDIAAVAARLLSSEDLVNQAFDLTGPQALTHAEVAVALSQASGRAIRYENIDPAVLRQGLLGAGLREDYSDFLLLILSFLAAGYSARVSDAVPRLLGRPAIDFARYAQEHRAAWAQA